MMDYRTLRPHPRAGVVPVMDPDQYDELLADIERRGIQVPLDILADGTIVDGRTRWQIASTLGIECPVRVIEPADPFDYMVRAALMRRDLTKSQRATLALELPEYQQAKAEAATRVGGRPTKTADTNGRGYVAGMTAYNNPATWPPNPTRATDAIAPLAGVSGSYIRKAARVKERDPELFERVRAGEVSVSAAQEEVDARPKAGTSTNKEKGRLPVRKATRPSRPWSRHFTRWCRNALPEDRPVLLEMQLEVESAIARIGGATA